VGIVWVCVVKAGISRGGMGMLCKRGIEAAHGAGKTRERTTRRRDEVVERRERTRGKHDGEVQLQDGDETGLAA